VEFLKITKLADWEHYRAGDVITQEGHKVPDLNLIYNGTVEVRVNKEIVAQLRDGQFVGEMSFLTGKPATATCIVKHDAVILVWKQDEFRELLKRNPSLYFTIQSLLSTQLSSSLVAQSKSL
jgi:CRP-like cAMP-binding protein